LLDALRRRELDAGVLLEQLDHSRLDGMDVRCIMRIPLGVALPVSHRLAKRRAIRVEDLDTDTLVLYSRALADIYDTVVALCRARGFTPARIEEADRVEAVLGLVAAGEGISIGPAIYSMFNFPGVAFAALTPAAKPLSLIVARNPEAKSGLAAAFVSKCVRTCTGWVA
jgi:DNA-binding transcriptional LysR family regulator